MAAAAEEGTMKKEEESVVTVNQEEDEHDSKERVLQKYFLQEWKLVKSLINDIVSNARVSDPSSVHKIRSIVLSPSLSYPVLALYCILISFS